MLGRLEMDVESAIAAYLEFSESIFERKRSKASVFSILSDFTKMKGRFSTANLERCVKRLVESRLGDENATLLSSSEQECKV